MVRLHAVLKQPGFKINQFVKISVSAKNSMMIYLIIV